MAIRHLTYLDLTDDQRREGAKQARSRIKSALMNPGLTASQKTEFKAQLARINKWAKCELEVCGIPADPPPS